MSNDMARVGAVPGIPPRFGHHDLVAAQWVTLATPRRNYGVPARVLVTLVDSLYGRERSLSKFKVLELVARVPCQSLQKLAHAAITPVHRRTGLAQRLHERLATSGTRQDDASGRLRILDELLAQQGHREGRVLYSWIPQVIALAYHPASWLLHVVQPAWSHRLDADFADHAEHEYMQFVAEHPELEDQPFSFAVAGGYGRCASLADLFRQIGHDKHFHKQESLAASARPATAKAA